MDNEEEQLQPARQDLATRRWVICADGEFGDAVVSDLAAIGLDVTLSMPTVAIPMSRGRWASSPAPAMTPSTSPWPSMRGSQSRRVYLVVASRRTPEGAAGNTADRIGVHRHRSHRREILARILTPVFWGFAEHVLTRDEHWATAVRDHLEKPLRPKDPEREVITLSAEQAPAIAAWFAPWALPCRR